MSKAHTEATFESTIECHLLTSGGYSRGDKDAFDRDRGLDPKVFLAFIQETQPKEWEYLKTIQKDKAEETLLDNLCRALGSEHEGCLSVLRHGFKCFGKLFRVAYFAPASGLNPDIQRLYAANHLTVTRQLRYSSKHGNTLDVVLSLNGIPLATAELKNPMTGQTWRNAVHQYKNDRDPKDPIFQFKKRTLVHFALDPDEVYMTTRLSGRSTHFLPFNKGCGPGAGNPGNPGGYKTAYLWEEVLERDSFLDILARFIHIQIEEKKLGAKTMVVTSSRLHAVRYKQSFDKYIAEKGYTGIKTLVAFSGTVIDPDVPDKEYTEVRMNDGIREKELPERFSTGEYQVLLVAEKYQTGFDQPLLHTMYVDKRLSGLQAVQTLSRLNRTYPGKEDTFVLDFINETQEILDAFQPYYEQTAIGERADPRQLY